MPTIDFWAEVYIVRLSSRRATVILGNSQNGITNETLERLADLHNTTSTRSVKLEYESMMALKKNYPYFHFEFESMIWSKKNC